MPLLHDAAAKLPNRAGPRLVLAMAQFQSGSTNEARKTLAAAVRGFNAETTSRRCPNCGFVHPPAYGLDAASDTPEEQEARATW